MMTSMSEIAGQLGRIENNAKIEEEETIVNET
jgi:hypothetical protein